MYILHGVLLSSKCKKIQDNEVWILFGKILFLNLLYNKQMCEIFRPTLDKE